MLMRRSAFLPLLGLALCAAPAAAQGADRMPGPAGPMHGGPGMMRGGPGPDPASMLLGATGRLKLSDAQVVRLAAIARRAAERHEAMRTRMQAAHAGAPNRQAAPSEAEMQRMHQQMEQMHEQMRGDLRDALAVLTPDQQATAFEMVAHHASGRGAHGPGNPGLHRRMAPGAHGRPGAPARMRHPGGPPPPRDGAAPRPEHPDAS
jgi:Spy/CpxP family protein refolding chaperone